MFKEKNKRIAFFIPDLEGGGAERVFVLIAGTFAKYGFEVDLVLASAKGPYLDEVPPAVRICNLSARRVLAALPKMVVYLRKTRPNILFSTLTHANLVAILARTISNVPCKVIVREANVILSIPPETVLNAKERALRIGAKLLYPKADAVIAVSGQVREDLIKIGIPPDKIYVIYNPIEIEKLEVLAGQEPEHPWFKQGEPPVVLGVGRLVPQKDFSTLIKAFAQVLQQSLARLVILGEGPERRNLEGLVAKLGLEKNVALPGFVRNPFPYIKRAAVMVLSSKWEGFPNVLIQALALGTPVVSTDCSSGPREILAGGRYGKLVKVGDVQGLAEAILGTLREPRNTEDLKARARAYSLEKIMPKYLNLALFDVQESKVKDEQG
ncbi:MAG: glycosyltransferase [Candidatus Hadarchaeum sp.]|uniref:glycosyltransferase n=1 Tax=Candidatus Hadarchaeum sp. TaxID=2883567 RepID=UPI003171FF40